MDELQAIARLQQGDLNGLEFLVQHYQVQAVHSAYLILGERPLAEDVAQTAFLKVARKIDQFDARYPFRAWFLRIVINDALKAAKRQQRNRSLDESPAAAQAWLTDPAKLPEELLETDEIRAAVWQALALLTPEQRAVIVQRHFLEMSEAEMAAEHQRPASTVKWWLHTARGRLRTLLKAYRAAGGKYDE
jgi:RNA polymerase sigma-70 factor, ECF subfamily